LQQQLGPPLHLLLLALPMHHHPLLQQRLGPLLHLETSLRRKMRLRLLVLLLVEVGGQLLDLHQLAHIHLLLHLPLLLRLWLQPLRHLLLLVVMLIEPQPLLQLLRPLLL
jgi:hypothetical protein